MARLTARMPALLLACAAISIVPPIEMAAQSPPKAPREQITVRSYDGRTMPAEIVRITVPERRATPGRTITAAALRIPSTAERPGRPIVFLMGGPGIPGSVMAPIPPYFTLFQSLRELADVVIVDQRGLGRSEPTIDCPVDGALPADLFLRRERIVQVLRDRVVACANRFRGTEIDPTAYNTVESADDLDDLRKALGAEQIDLLAFSYGSRLALMYVQRHGDHVGRIVLQGVNGPGLVLRRPGPVARKLDRLADILRQDSTWRGPTDLRAAAAAARERLARNPATLTIADRRTGRPVELVVGRDGFDAIIGLNLDDARVPALLVSVAAQDDRVLARFVEAAWNGLAGGTVGLMARAVNCAADRPASRWETVRSESASAPFGSPIENEFLTDEFCRALGYRASPVEFPGPVVSSAPLLLLTGTLDATNPLENAAEVARGFANGLSLEVANAAHEALPVPAVQAVVVDWFRGAEVRGRPLAAPPPRFATVEAAAAPPPPRPSQAPAAATTPPDPILGRWNLRILDARDVSSSWLEVERSGFRALVGRFVGLIGGARPIGRIDWNDGVARFAIPTEWETPTGELRFEIRPAGDSLTGTFVRPDGSTSAFVGKRAPALLHEPPPAWSAPAALFNGKDLSGWTPAPTARSLPNQWIVRDGILVNTANEGANLMTIRRFGDFRLHAEYRLAPGATSGIFPRGRYWVMLKDVPDAVPARGTTGAVHRFFIPSENANLGAGVWQSIDITLVGRRITVVVNGKTVIANQIIPGPTGSAIDSDEGAPGPIMLQGEEQRVEFRNITISEPLAHRP